MGICGIFRYDFSKFLSQTGERTIQAATELTRLITAIGDGDSAAYDDAIVLMYEELRRIAHIQLVKRNGEFTLQTTALVNEAYIKLKNGDFEPVNRGHFLAIAATAMRHIVIDYAKSRRAAKRGGGVNHIELDEDHAKIDAEAEKLLLVNDALNTLSRDHKRLARIFECKFFAGFDDSETASAVGVSERTVQRDWIKARAFLQEQLGEIS